MKRIIILIFLIGILNILYPTTKTEINIFNTLNIKLPDTIKIKNHYEDIFTDDYDKTKIMVSATFECSYNKTQKFFLYVYLKPKKGINLNKIKIFLKINERFASTNFGFGDEYSLLNEHGIDFIIDKKLKVKKYVVSSWGMLSDILLYNIKDNGNDYFEEYLFEFASLWPDQDNVPNNLNINLINELSKKNDKRVAIYKDIDEIIYNIEFISNIKNIKKNQYTPTIPNLRFRETPTSDGKFIRMLTKGEKLELVEKGKAETVNGVKGNWVKVKTDKGEIGWCFDGYLEEVK